jgi:peptidoglycan/xylan/chitin deacetylase (PgdA/CDA1 family)
VTQVRIALRRLRQRFVRESGPADAVILMYHRIAPDGSAGGGLAVTPSNFSEHLQALRSALRPIRLSDLVDSLAQDTLPPRSVAITFDDGYLDNLVVAKPLLEQWGTPATVFVVSSYVGSGRRFWWDELERVCLAAELPPTVELVLGGRTRRWQVPADDRRHLFRELRQALGQLEERERNELLAHLQRLSRTSAPNRVETLSRDQLGRLAEGDLVDIGAHTVTHPRLTDVSGKRQVDEIEQSRRQLAELLGVEISLFSYPFGAHDARTVRSARRAGVSCACTTVATGVRTTDDPFRLPRLAVDDWSGDELVARLERLCGWTIRS